MGLTVGEGQQGWSDFSSPKMICLLMALVGTDSNSRGRSFHICGRLGCLFRDPKNQKKKEMMSDSL